MVFSPFLYSVGYGKLNQKQMGKSETLLYNVLASFLTELSPGSGSQGIQSFSLRPPFFSPPLALNEKGARALLFRRAPSQTCDADLLKGGRSVTLEARA
jgi:hypothetical protein